MIEDLDQIASCIWSHHFPNHGASEQDIDDRQRALGHVFPPEMRQFYLRINGASLFRRRNEVPPFRLLSIAEIATARLKVYGAEEDSYGAACEIAFCDRGDGDFVAIDLAESDRNPPAAGPPIIDVWHEAYPNKEHCPVICHGFVAFLKLALASEGDSFFWGRQ